MKKSIIVAAAGLFLAGSLISPEVGYSKKGGIGEGGGYQDGVLYHSHSDRSYSGRDIKKGKGKGQTKVKKNKGKGKAKGKKKSQAPTPGAPPPPLPQ